MCPTDKAVFVCHREDSPITSWRVELVKGASINFGLNANFESPGTIINRALNGVQVTVRVISGNSSFIYSSLTLARVKGFNMTTITCNINRVTYILPNSKKISRQMVLL